MGDVFSALARIEGSEELMVEELMVIDCDRPRLLDRYELGISWISLGNGAPARSNGVPKISIQDDVNLVRLNGLA